MLKFKKIYLKRGIRHSREGGNPSPDLTNLSHLAQKSRVQELDSRLRGNDEALVVKYCAN